MHNKFDVCDVVTETLFGESEQESPVAGEIDAVRLTVPVKLLIGATWIVDAPAVPAFPVTPVGLADIEKSVMFTVTVAVCEIAPLVAFTVTE